MRPSSGSSWVFTGASRRLSDSTPVPRAAVQQVVEVPERPHRESQPVVQATLRDMCNMQTVTASWAQYPGLQADRQLKSEIDSVLMHVTTLVSGSQVALCAGASEASMTWKILRGKVNLPNGSRDAAEGEEVASTDEEMTSTASPYHSPNKEIEEDGAKPVEEDGAKPVEEDGAKPWSEEKKRKMMKTHLECLMFVKRLGGDDCVARQVRQVLGTFSWKA